MIQRAVEAFRTGARTSALAQRIAGLPFFPRTWIEWVRFGALVAVFVALLGGFVIWKILQVLPRHPSVSITLVGDRDPPPELTSADQRKLLDDFQPIFYFALTGPHLSVQWL